MTIILRMTTRRSWGGAACIVLLSTACYPAGWRGVETAYDDPADSPFSVGPYLVKTGPQRVAVVVEHALEAPPELVWWLEDEQQTDPPEERNYQSFLKRDGLWVATLEDLPSDRRVAYVVRSAIGESPRRRFRAARPRGEKFRFVALGDTRNGHRVHRSLVEAIALEDPDFVINSGDLVETGGYKEQWDLFFRIEQPVTSKSLLFAAAGNHDVSPRKLFRRWFLLDDWAFGNRYYQHDWSDVKVIVLDTELELRAGTPQQDFLIRALEDAVARDMLIVVSFHYPPYSSGAHGPNPRLQKIFDELGPRYGIELILNGHDHNYERTKPIEGVTYIVAASGGAPIRRLQPSWWSASVRTEPHYVVFDVDRGNLIGRAVNLDGAVFDSFIIQPHAPRSPRR
ncbi:MAG: hypothetical protein HC923_02560 [Myxococcales bacterium]|nr:hypothetical protein [Myxococcales bacterium]